MQQMGKLHTKEFFRGGLLREGWSVEGWRNGGFGVVGEVLSGLFRRIATPGIAA